MRVLNSITLKFGSSPNAQPLAINASNPLLVIGPNNSGKSTLLKEIEDSLTNTGHRSDSTVILESCEAIPFSEEQAVSFIDNSESSEPCG